MVKALFADVRASPRLFAALAAVPAVSIGSLVYAKKASGKRRLAGLAAFLATQGGILYKLAALARAFKNLAHLEAEAKQQGEAIQAWIHHVRGSNDAAGLEELRGEKGALYSTQVFVMRRTVAQLDPTGAVFKQASDLQSRLLAELRSIGITFVGQTAAMFAESDSLCLKMAALAPLIASFDYAKFYESDPHQGWEDFVGLAATTSTGDYAGAAEVFRKYTSMDVRGANRAQLKKAYLAAQQKLHPDKGGNARKSQELNDAWQIIQSQLGVNKPAPKRPNKPSNKPRSANATPANSTPANKPANAPRVNSSTLTKAQRNARATFRNTYLADLNASRESLSEQQRDGQLNPKAQRRAQLAYQKAQVALAKLQNVPTANYQQKLREFDAFFKTLQ